MADEDKQPVPYDRFKEVVDAKNALDAQLKAAQAAQTALAAERESLAAKLADEQKAALAKMTEVSGKLQASELDALRLRVAVAAGLPLDLAARLQGATEAELAADAAKIVPLIRPAAPGVPPPGGGATPAVLDMRNMSAKEIRENEEKLRAQARGK